MERKKSFFSTATAGISRFAEKVCSLWRRFLGKAEKWAPPGLDLETEIGLDIMLILFYLFFFWAIFAVHMGGMTVIYKPGPDAEVIHCRSMMWVMRNTCIFMVIIIIWFCHCIKRNYASFTKGSMSIYTMKRVSDAMEIHKRCLAIPAAFMAVILLFTVINVLWGISIYNAHLPEKYVLEREIPFSIWRLIICLR